MAVPTVIRGHFGSASILLALENSEQDVWARAYTLRRTAELCRRLYALQLENSEQDARTPKSIF